MSGEFKPFGKIPRFNREIVVTEKIDGTNGLVYVDAEGNVRAGSRNRWITPESDNFGFASWVHEHYDELTTLGEGYHYGEWYGKDIQRGYGLDHKRFMLFNVAKWENTRPECCEVATVLYRGLLSQTKINDEVHTLNTVGSFHVPGYNKPEGVVIYHTSSNHIYKVLCENDEGHKG